VLSLQLLSVVSIFRFLPRRFHRPSCGRDFRLFNSTRCIFSIIYFRWFCFRGVALQTYMSALPTDSRNRVAKSVHTSSTRSARPTSPLRPLSQLDFFKGQNWRFCARFGGLCQAAYASQSRTESSPAALRSFCGSTGEAPPPPAASVALHLRGCGLESAYRASRC
jgi:hypothetical protein